MIKAIGNEDAIPKARLQEKVRKRLEYVQRKNGMKYFLMLLVLSPAWVVSNSLLQMQHLTGTFWHAGITFAKRAKKQKVVAGANDDEASTSTASEPATAVVAATINEAISSSDDE